ncbi:unnamed protein product, partial [marine sediment metagenome]
AKLPSSSHALHPGMDITQSAISGHYLQSMLAKTYHIVLTYRTAIFEAEYLIRVKLFPWLAIG